MRLENPSWKSSLMETSDDANCSAVSSKIAFVLNGLAVADGFDPQSAFSAPKCERNEVCRQYKPPGTELKKSGKYKNFAPHYEPEADHMAAFKAKNSRRVSTAFSRYQESLRI